MRASSTSRRARWAAGAAALAALLAPSLAFSDDPGDLRAEAERLRAENRGLASGAHEALLELYSLETRLARAEARVAELERRQDEVEEAEDSARRGLAIARAGLAEAERRLASRLQTLYVEGDIDPLAVLLGAESLDDALSALDGLNRFAADDGQIVGQVRESRRTLQGSLRELAERRAELARLVAEAGATRSSLAETHAERSAYLTGLREEQALNERRIAGLVDQAAAAEARSAEVSAPAPAVQAAPAPAPTPAASPAVTTVASPSGSRMTVQSTGYCLRGTTATGIPTGWGVVAVDPAVIPLGTKMFVPGYGEGVAADTGSAVKGAIIDVWFPSCAQALQWGRRTVTITLY
ncbi:MAG TPA: 3D domain-containing protein [Gaiellaceae bacterium]|nr:3D domain-containing protein [Gaiellaceae bacterium]